MAIELWVTPSQQQRRHYWGIVLAGGEGKRLRDFLKREYKQESPKQFCSITGKRSMLKHTLDRAASLIPEQRLLTVISRQHLLFAIEEISQRDPKTIVTVPLNRETGPSLLLALMRIYKMDPESVVAVFPSDHFIVEEDLFMNYVCGAFDFISTNPQSIAALGVPPTSIQPGYGWMEKGQILSTKGGISVYKVRRFYEKPEADEMRRLLPQDCLWNTMTMVGRAEMFLRLFQEFVPDLFISFQRINHALGTPFETEVIFDVFETLPVVNFSQAILERIPHYLCVIPLHGVYWNDWGDEHRIRADLSRFASYRRAPEPELELVELKNKNYSIELSSKRHLEEEGITA